MFEGMFAPVKVTGVNYKFSPPEACFLILKICLHASCLKLLKYSKYSYRSWLKRLALLAFSITWAEGLELWKTSNFRDLAICQCSQLPTTTIRSEFQNKASVASQNMEEALQSLTWVLSETQHACIASLAVTIVATQAARGLCISYLCNSHDAEIVATITFWFRGNSATECEGLSGTSSP